MDLEFGFSWPGLVIFALPMLINIVYAIFPPANAPRETEKVSRFAEAVEQITRILYMLAICLFVSQSEIDCGSVWMYSGAAFLILYYLVWIRYFAGGRDVALLSKRFLMVPMPLAVFPVLYYLLAAIWMHNLPAAIIMVIFGIAHNYVSYKAFRRGIRRSGNPQKRIKLKRESDKDCAERLEELREPLNYYIRSRLNNTTDTSMPSFLYSASYMQVQRPINVSSEQKADVAVQEQKPDDAVREQGSDDAEQKRSSFSVQNTEKKSSGPAQIGRMLYDPSPLYTIQEPRKKADKPSEPLRTDSRHPGLDKFLAAKGESFSETLLRMIDEKGLRDSDVYKKANIDRRLFSKIRADEEYVPSKKTAISFCLALQLGLKEARELLATAGYTLSNSSRFDLIIMYLINHSEYSVHFANIVLDDYGEGTLSR